MSRPRLTVVIPNYNDGSYIDAALRAITTQSRKADEIVVVDDGSTDNSVEIIERFIRRDSTIRLLRNERNMGMVFSSQRGFDSSSGDYIYWASANDRALPDLFKHSMDLLTQFPEAGLFCSDFSVFYDSESALIKKLRWASRPSYLSPQQLTSQIRRWGNYIPGATSIFKKSALIAAGGIRPELKGHSDWFAYHVIGFRHGLCYCPAPLAAWRSSQPGSQSTRARSWSLQREVLNFLLVLLDSPDYEDVRPMFRKSAALSVLPHIMRALLSSESGHHQFLSPLLIQRATYKVLGRFLLARAPLPVLRTYGALQRNQSILPQLRDSTE